MAVNDVWTALTEIAAGVASLSEHNEQRTDNMRVIELVMEGDQSTSGKVHRHKSGTLANRPTVGKASRIYYAADVGDGIWFFDDGDDWIPLGVQVLDRDLSQVDVANTAVETSIYSFAIPAGVLGATGGARLTIAGDILKNAAETLTIKVKLGATTVLTSNALAIPNDAVRYKFDLSALFLNSAANAQKWTTATCVILGAGGINFTIRDASVAGVVIGRGQASSAEDTSAARTLDVTTQWSGADANCSFRKELALFELLPGA